MKVWILQTGEPLQIDSAGLRPMRAINLSNALIERGHDVVLWSADFDHFSKKHRFGKEHQIEISPHLEIRLIRSRGYVSHFGLSRLIDHAQLGWNLRKMLRTESVPDVAFIGYPPVEPAWVMSRWLKRKRVPFVLDIKDAWPEILLRAFPRVLHPFLKLILTPYYLAMKSSFRSATALSSVTQDFLSWCIEASGRKVNDNNVVNYLTAARTDEEENQYKEAKFFLDKLGVNDSGQLRGAFIGTLNSAFDFGPIFSVARKLPIEFIIAGSGPLFNQLSAEAENYSNVQLIGWITQAQSKALVSRSTFMLAPYKDLPDFEIHIPNKFFDAMYNGMPVVTSITGIAKKLVENENIGVTYSAANPDSLVDVLIPLVSSPDKFIEMSLSAKNLYNQKFSYEKVYGDCVTHLEALADSGSS